MKSAWQKHDGKLFFFARYDSLEIEQLRDECAAIQKELEIQPADSVLLLVNPQDSLVSPEAIDLYRSHAKNSKHALRRIAVLRMTGWKSFVMDMVLGVVGRDNGKVFDDEESAREWLVAA